jgi:hypothetical protein
MLAASFSSLAFRYGLGHVCTSKAQQDAKLKFVAASQHEGYTSLYRETANRKEMRKFEWTGTDK